jgi:hypothetical protein
MKSRDTAGSNAKSGTAAGNTAKRTLPPDPENQNDDRATWAATALRAFRKATGTDEEDALGDLLADLMHWSDRNNFDFDAALDRARMHYEAETADADSP